MQCKCDKAGWCETLKRHQTEEHLNICQMNVNQVEKAARIQQNWLKMAGKDIDPDECPYRGDQIKVETCNICGNRGKPIPVYNCSIHGTCSVTAHNVKQTDHLCETCKDKPKPLDKVWDKQVSNLLPNKTNQNFNCSIIEYVGTKIFAWRHRWGGAQIGICELDNNWKPTKQQLLHFPYTINNVYQEDPRLFIFKDQLHVAFTAVRPESRHPNKVVAKVGYASLKLNSQKTQWVIDKTYLPEYTDSMHWEKNWGFFESQGKLWCVYDAEKHIILEMDNGKPRLAYSNNVRTIPGSSGLIRGGASPQFFRGQFYSFIHFRQEPKFYRGGLYTFDSQPPFNITGYVPYAFLNPVKEHCTNAHASEVVYPAGAALIDWRWVISYGAYDKDSRLAAYDVNEVEKAIKRRVVT